MKILLINNFHYIKGGSEAVYFNMARMFASRGDSVIFFSCTSERNEQWGSNEYFIESNSSVNPVKGAIRYIYNIRAKKALEALISKERPDIAHIHLFWGGLSSSILGVLNKHNIPVVHTAHDYRMICPAYTFRRPNGNICQKCLNGSYIHCLLHRCIKGKVVHSALACLEATFRRWFIKPAEAIDGFVFVSHFSYEQHLKAMPKLLHSQVLVLHNAIAPLPQSAISDSMGSYYLYFGRLSYEKGLTTLIKTFTTLPHLKLKIVGEGPQEAELRAIAITDNIEFVGYQSGEILRQTIRQSKAIIVPSEWYENNPMTIIEASAAGIPTIGANIGGITEIVREGKTGFLFKSKSCEQLKEAILRMEDVNQTQYIQMSNQCRQMAVELFSEESMYPKIIDFYSKIINNYESKATRN